MKTKAQIILLTAVCTTLFWLAVMATLLWWVANGSASAQVSFFSRPGELEIFSGTFRVEVVASNATSSSLLFSHMARAPERVSFSIERLDTRTAQR